MIKQFVETLSSIFALQLRHSMNERVERPPRTSHTHALGIYIAEWIQNKLVALLFCGSRHHLASETMAHGNEKRPAAPGQNRGGETNSTQVNWSVTSAGDSRSILMRLVRKLAEIRLPLTKRRRHYIIYLHARAEPNTRIFVFVCASGEFIQPPHSFINKLLAGCSSVICVCARVYL